MAGGTNAAHTAPVAWSSTVSPLLSPGTPGAGKKRSLYFGRTELGEAKKLRQININFVNDPDTIVISKTDRPHACELNDIHLPNSKMYSRQASGVDKKELTTYDYFVQDKALRHRRGPY